MKFWILAVGVIEGAGKPEFDSLEKSWVDIIQTNISFTNKLSEIIC